MITRGMGTDTLVTRGMGAGIWIPVTYYPGGGGGPTIGVGSPPGRQSKFDQALQEDRIVIEILRAFLKEVSK